MKKVFPVSPLVDHTSELHSKTKEVSTTMVIVTVAGIKLSIEKNHSWSHTKEASLTIMTGAYIHKDSFSRIKILSAIIGSIIDINW